MEFSPLTEAQYGQYFIPPWARLSRRSSVSGSANTCLLPSYFVSFATNIPDRPPPRPVPLQCQSFCGDCKACIIKSTRSIIGPHLTPAPECPGSLSAVGTNRRNRSPMPPSAQSYREIILATPRVAQKDFQPCQAGVQSLVLLERGPFGRIIRMRPPQVFFQSLSAKSSQTLPLGKEVASAG
jgi:hypothetical protein